MALGQDLVPPLLVTAYQTLVCGRIPGIDLQGGREPSLSLLVLAELEKQAGDFAAQARIAGRLRHLGDQCVEPFAVGF
jgi:hypothetical protein